jgi:integrase
MAKPTKTRNLFDRDGVPWMDWTHREEVTGRAIKRYRLSLDQVAGRPVRLKEDQLAVMEKTKTAIREGRWRGTLAASELTDYAIKSGRTIASLVAEYEETQVPNMSVTANVMPPLRRFAKHYGDRPITEMAADVAEMLRYFEGLKQPENLHKYERAACVRTVGTRGIHVKRIRRFFNWALETGYIDRTPFRDPRSQKVLIKVPRGARPRKCPLTIAEQQQIIAAVAEDHPPAVGWILVALDTGLRRAEQFGRYVRRGTRDQEFDWTSGIRVKDMNFFTRKLTVRDVVAKSGKKRVITIATARAFNVLKHACQPNGVARHPEELIFTTVDGTPLPRTAPLWRLQKAAKACGITVDVFWHGLRHVFGRNGLQAGIPPAFLQRVYGHATLQQTVDYLDVDDDNVDLSALARVVEPKPAGGSGDTVTTQEGGHVAQTA